MIKQTSSFLFDDFKKICCLTVGDTIETNNGKYKVADFNQICVFKDDIPYPGHAIITETGEKIMSTDVINVVDVTSTSIYPEENILNYE